MTGDRRRRAERWCYGVDRRVGISVSCPVGLPRRRDVTADMVGARDRRRRARVGVEYSFLVAGTPLGCRFPRPVSAPVIHHGSTNISLVEPSEAVSRWSPSTARTVLNALNAGDRSPSSTQCLEASSTRDTRDPRHYPDRCGRPLRSSPGPISRSSRS